MNNLVSYFFITFSIVLSYSSVHSSDFFQDQITAPRVKAAIMKKQNIIENLFKDKEIKFPPSKILIRIFKEEMEIEIWAKSRTDSTMSLIKTYEMTASSGNLGPKRCQGDLQIPEGFYQIDRFNPWSKFHLSLGLDYPNNSDRILSSCKDPGGDIFIHGDKVTIGCIPVGDESIEEIYIIALYAYHESKNKIPVHIFPFRFDKMTREELFKRFSSYNPEFNEFWLALLPGYYIFNDSKNIPQTVIDSDGKYKFAEEND